MTELMKRYEAREGRPPTIFIKEFGYLFTDSFVAWLALENAELKAQLTWIPIADRLPLDAQKEQVFVKYKDLSVGVMGAQSVKLYRHTATHWLPIPPQGE